MRLRLCSSVRAGEKQPYSWKQICVDHPRSSALSMTLPAIFAKRGRLQQIYQSILAAGARAQQQTSRTPLKLSIDGTDGRTDRRTPYRYTDPAAHTICGRR